MRCSGAPLKMPYCAAGEYNATAAAECFTSPEAETARELAEALLARLEEQGVGPPGSGEAIWLGRRRLADTKGPSDDYISELASLYSQRLESHEKSLMSGGRPRALSSSGGGSLKAAVPQSTAVGVLWAGETLELEVALRGKVELTGTAISASDNKATVNLRALPASVGNMQSKMGKCADTSGDAQTSSTKWEVVEDACGTTVGMVASDALAIHSAVRIRETSHLCITPRGDIAVDTSKYPDVDVVVDKGNGVLSVPLGATLTDDTGGTNSKCLYAQPGLSYILVYRSATYESDVANCPPAPPPPPVKECRETYGGGDGFLDEGTSLVLFVGIGVGVLLCLCLCLCRRRMKRKRAGSVKATANTDQQNGRKMTFFGRKKNVKPAQGVRMQSPTAALPLPNPSGSRSQGNAVQEA